MQTVLCSKTCKNFFPGLLRAHTLYCALNSVNIYQQSILWQFDSLISCSATAAGLSPQRRRAHEKQVKA
jgi:hypothetical protein